MQYYTDEKLKQQCCSGKRMDAFYCYNDHRRKGSTTTGKFKKPAKGEANYKSKCRQERPNLREEDSQCSHCSSNASSYGGCPSKSPNNGCRMNNIQQVLNTCKNIMQAPPPYPTCAARQGHMQPQCSNNAPAKKCCCGRTNNGNGYANNRCLKSQHASNPWSLGYSNLPQGQRCDKSRKADEINTEILIRRRTLQDDSDTEDQTMCQGNRMQPPNRRMVPRPCCCHVARDC